MPAKRAAFTPRCPAFQPDLYKGFMLPLTLAMLLRSGSLQRADRGGCHQPRPAQWDSDAALLIPDRGRGALRPPQGSSVGGARESGREPFLLLAARAPVSRGRWPLTRMVPGPLNGAGLHQGLSTLPANQGERERPWQPLHAPRLHTHPAGSTYYGVAWSWCQLPVWPKPPPSCNTRPGPIKGLWALAQIGS